MQTWRESYPLEKIKPLKKTIKRLFIWVIIFFFIACFLWVQASSTDAAKIFGWNQFVWFPWLCIAVVIVIGILTYIYQVFYMKYYSYDMQGKNLIIAKGVFSRNQITLPVNRIQDVYLDQDILDRIFGLYDVHVSSVTATSGLLSHIDGVNKENSEKLKTLLLKAIYQ